MIAKIRSTEPKILALIALCVVLAFVSLFGVAPQMEKPESYPRTIESLNNKRNAVVEMSAALIGVSVVVAAVPGDATTPIANQISQLNSYLILVLGAIMLEKFLLPIIALVVFRGLVPIGFILLGLYLFLERKVLRSAALHFFVVGAAMICLIPAGVKIGDMIDDSFGTDDLLAKISTDIQQMTDEITASAEEGVAQAGEKVKDDGSTSKKKADADKDKGILEQISGFKKSITDLGDSISSLKEDISEGISNLGSTFTNAAAEAIEKAKVIMGDLMDAVAILLVTVCVIPIVTLMALAAIVKFLFRLLLRQVEDY